MNDDEAILRKIVTIQNPLESGDIYCSSLLESSKYHLIPGR